MRVRVLHVITALGVGGAERMLCDLAQALRARGLVQKVVALVDGGATGIALRASGIPVASLGLERGRMRSSAFTKLASAMREFDPDVVQSWLYHADLLATLAAAVVRPPALAWNIRCSEMELEQYGRSTRLTVQACARLSGIVAAVVVNSRAGRKGHERLGYHPSRWVHLPNGVRADVYRPSPEARRSVREELRLAPGIRLVGMLARFDPMKDHETFLAAASQLSRGEPDVHFLLAGEGIVPSCKLIADGIERGGLHGRVHLLGPRNDPERLLAALDLYAMTSRFGEGFPNSVAQALACGVPCVVTDVGDAAWMVADAGRVVAVGEPGAMAEAWAGLLALDGPASASLRAAARRRAVDEFSWDTCVDRYEELYRGLAEDATCVA